MEPYASVVLGYIPLLQGLEEQCKERWSSFRETSEGGERTLHETELKLESDHEGIVPPPSIEKQGLSASLMFHLWTVR